MGISKLAALVAIPAVAAAIGSGLLIPKAIDASKDAKELREWAIAVHPEIVLVEKLKSSADSMSYARTALTYYMERAAYNVYDDEGNFVRHVPAEYHYPSTPESMRKLDQAVFRLDEAEFRLGDEGYSIMQDTIVLGNHIDTLRRYAGESHYVGERVAIIDLHDRAMNEAYRLDAFVPQEVRQEMSDANGRSVGLWVGGILLALGAAVGLVAVPVIQYKHSVYGSRSYSKYRF